MSWEIYLPMKLADLSWRSLSIPFHQFSSLNSTLDQLKYTYLLEHTSLERFTFSNYRTVYLYIFFLKRQDEMIKKRV